MSLYLRQLALGPMKNFVYLVGPSQGRQTLVVDPAWDIPAVEAALEADGRELVGVFATHHHGDHINGLEALLALHDVPVYAQGVEVDFSPDLQAFASVLKRLAPGDPLAVGALSFRALHTPGHTPGSHCLLAGDALFSGDTLFVNHCGRCDFPGGDPREMFHSLRQVLLGLPPQTRVMPGHHYGDVPTSSLAREAEHNPYLQQDDVEAFVRLRMRPRG